jgi:response regulator RpfG family c-di-GMP phosphodiesterase
MGMGKARPGEIFVVSPDAAVRRAIAEPFAGSPVRVVTAFTPEEGLSAARSASAELAVIDAALPAPLEYVARVLKLNPALGLLLVVGEQDSALALEAVRGGAYDFVTRPVDPRKSRIRIEVALERHSRVLEERAYTVALEERMVQRTEEVLEGRERIRAQFINTIRALEKALQAKSVYTEGHSRRVAEKAVEIARAMRVPRDHLHNIELGALFHDIGKIGIRDNVLNKASKLTDSEYEHMKIHPLVAEQILSPIEELRPIVEIVKHEHERWDGRGYPDGLKGESIPLGARLIAIADAWDSMVFDRIYRSAISPEAALAEIERNAGTQFDPGCVKVFLALERARLLQSQSVVPAAK